MTIIEKIHSKVKVNENGCWIWQDNRKKKEEDVYGKYGIIFFGGRQDYAHRVSYQAFVGEIPGGMLVCHTCDVRECVNPKHLFLGTHQVNIDDAVAKGRRRNGPRKFSDDQVIQISQRYINGERPSALAREYGTRACYITGIATGRTHKYLQREIASPQLPNRRKKTPPKIGTEREGDVIIARLSGEGVDSIAKRFGVSKQTIYNILQRNAVKPPPKAHEQPALYDNMVEDQCPTSLGKEIPPAG